VADAPVTWKAAYLRAGACRHPECVVLRGGSLASREFPALVVHLQHPRHGHVLFDTGYTEAFHAATRPFPERLYAWTTPVRLAAGECARTRLQTRGVAPQDIGTVVLSHLHGDHAAGLGDFPDARVALRRDAFEALQEASRWNAVRKGYLRALLPSNLPSRACWIEDLPGHVLPRELEAFGAGRDLFGDGSFLLVDLPGHAPGHVGAFFIDGDRGPTFLLADACWTREALEAWRPPHPVSHLVTHDAPAMRRTLHALVALRARSPGLLMVPSHCAATLAALASPASDPTDA
jgi:glyoxylase-like metal-dependent hydrolase (beta-lactamase superfamily II)